MTPWYLRQAEEFLEAADSVGERRDATRRIRRAGGLTAEQIDRIFPAMALAYPNNVQVRARA